MDTTMTSHRKRTLPERKGKCERGFTLMEVLISICVLTIGLVSLLGVFGIALATTQTAQLDLMAKQVATETMESIYSARDTNNVQWEGIQNVTVVNPDGTTGIFLTGFQPVNNPGVDGIFGTADDAAAGTQTLTPPGPDGTYGNADDASAAIPLTNFQRQISISDIDPFTGAALAGNLRAYTITVQYTTPQFHLPKQYTLAGYISQYR